MMHVLVGFAGGLVFHIDGDIHLAGLFKGQRHRYLVAGFQLLGQANHHDVIAVARLHRDFFRRLDFNAADFPHFHHIAIHRHGVDFSRLGGRRGNADQLVGAFAFVFNAQISTARWLAGYGSACIRVADQQIANFVFMGAGGSAQQQGGTEAENVAERHKNP